MHKSNTLKITLIRSLSKKLPSHKSTAHSLGLRRINQSVLVVDNPIMQGMIKKISYLLNVETETI